MAVNGRTGARAAQRGTRTRKLELSEAQERRGPSQQPGGLLQGTVSSVTDARAQDACQRERERACYRGILVIKSATQKREERGARERAEPGEDAMTLGGLVFQPNKASSGMLAHLANGEIFNPQGGTNLEPLSPKGAAGAKKRSSCGKGEAGFLWGAGKNGSFQSQMLARERFGSAFPIRSQQTSKRCRG